MDGGQLGNRARVRRDHLLKLGSSKSNIGTRLGLRVSAGSSWGDFLQLYGELVSVRPESSSDTGAGQAKPQRPP